MSKLIDIDDVANAIYHHFPSVRTMADARAVIEEAPSIEIVRCKECKWLKANGTYQWCGRLDSTARITADDFCSYGQKERASDEIRNSD